MCGPSTWRRSSIECGFFFQAEDGIRDLVRSRGLGDVYKRQDFKPRVNLLNFNLEELLNMEEDEFNLKFEGSPIKRTKLSGIKRNIESIKVHHKK